MMDMNMIQFHEKVYVVLGNEIQEEEGCLTLNWVINKWASYHHPFSIVILFINSSSSSPCEFVDTPFGKLPASSVSDDMLQTWRKCEQDKIDKLFNKYIAFCGKVKAEIQSIMNKQDEPIQKTVVDLIIEKRITKLVMGMTFMRSSSSGRSKNAISGSFYIHRTKPDFCELFIISKGKLVFVKEENDEGYIEDEEGKIVAKLKKKGSLRDWLLEKMLPNGQVKSPTYPSPKSSCMECDSPFSRNSNDWDFYEQDVEDYFKELVDSMKEKKESVEEYASSTSCIHNSPSHQNILVDGIQELQISGDSVEDLKKKIQEARTLIESNKNAVETEVDRQAKAQWAISLCNTRAEKLQAQIAEDISTRNDLTKEIDNTKEQMNEILADVQENKNRLKSLLELQSELSSKLHSSSLAKLGAETQLENATHTRVELVREIEELRKQRDVFQRRIKFCKEKDAIGLATRMSEQVMSCSYREFNADEIRVATGNFSVYSRLACGGDCRSSVYKGRINRLSVAVQMLDSEVEMSQEIFQSKVNLLANTRHPHLTAFIGFCSELRCLVFEYMHNGCLRDILFSRTKARVLQWHQRIQIAAQISLGIQFLNLAEPRPILCNGLNPSTIYLDKNLVAKLNSFEFTPCCDEANVQAEVNAFGDLLLQLLTGRNWARIDHEAMLTNKQVILEALDGNAGDWPSDLVEEIVHLGIKCRSLYSEPNVRAIMSSVTKTLNELKKKADVMTMREYRKDSEDSVCSDGEEWSHVPSNFLCPILQVIMDNPHIAADGHSYELEAIEEWLRMGHDTSPVTNQKLKHKYLVPNNNLRFLIQDWRKFVNLLKNMDSSGDGKSNQLELRPLSISHLCLL